MGEDEVEFVSSVGAIEWEYRTKIAGIVKNIAEYILKDELQEFKYAVDENAVEIQVDGGDVEQPIFEALAEMLENKLTEMHLYPGVVARVYPDPYRGVIVLFMGD